MLRNISFTKENIKEILSEKNEPAATGPAI